MGLYTIQQSERNFSRKLMDIFSNKKDAADGRTGNAADGRTRNAADGRTSDEVMISFGR